MKSNTKLFFLFAVLVIFDQIAKHLVSTSFCNKNLAWSLPLPGGFFYVIWTAVVIGLMYFLLNTKSPSQKIFFVLILSGAFSNIIDRIRLGCVVDYIDLKFFPVFNLADAYITVGLILFILSSIRTKRPA
jgi:signal peptidase II